MSTLDHVPGIPCPKPVRAPKKARKPMKRSNRKRKAKMYARNYGERGDSVRAMPCLLAASGGCEGRIQAAHADARGMGSVGGDRRSLVPLCSHHHRQSHRMPLADFTARYRVSLDIEAARIALELDARGLP